MTSGCWWNFEFFIVSWYIYCGCSRINRWKTLSIRAYFVPSLVVWHDLRFQIVTLISMTNCHCGGSHRQSHVQDVRDLHHASTWNKRQSRGTLCSEQGRDMEWQASATVRQVSRLAFMEPWTGDGGVTCCAGSEWRTVSQTSQMPPVSAASGGRSFAESDSVGRRRNATFSAPEKIASWYRVHRCQSRHIVSPLWSTRARAVSKCPRYAAQCSGLQPCRSVVFASSYA